jgi:hypothetical protein
MTSSPTIAIVAAALVKAQKEMSNAKKDATNPFFKKNYADINSVREAVLPALNTHGISVIQPTCVIDGVDYVETILLHESGEFISSLTRIVVDKVNDAQRHGSGLSYARRYALSSITNIGTEDDDANAATGKATLKSPGTPAASVWSPTAAELQELSDLVDNSTLEDKRKQNARIAVTNCKTQKEVDKIKAALLKSQPNV